MSSFDDLGSDFRIEIPKDDGGYLGRECPEQECVGYFKVKPGTGLSGEATCRCPYCGHEDANDKFYTKAQIEYAKSVVMNKVSGALIKDLKKLEFDYKARGGFGIGVSMKVHGRPEPIRHYTEQDLETRVTCDNCGLEYSVFGVFGFCSDCGVHNSEQILAKNLDQAAKRLLLSEREEDTSLAENLVGDALAFAVSSFDGFGRELCRIHRPKATNQGEVDKLSFQNLQGAHSRLQSLFGLDLAAYVTGDEWTMAVRAFQKRHVLAHKMGVVDAEYVRRTGDQAAVVGRKIAINRGEVEELLRIVRTLGSELARRLQALPGGGSP